MGVSQQASRVTNNNTINWGYTIQSSGQHIFNTSGKYVDTNIVVDVPAAAGSVAMTAGNGVCGVKSSNGVTYSTSDSDNNAGCYIQAKGSGSVSAAANITTAGYVAKKDSFATGESTSSKEATATFYINGVTIAAPSSGERTFSITVPNGTSATNTFTFHVDSSSNVWVD